MPAYARPSPPAEQLSGPVLEQQLAAAGLTPERFYRNNNVLYFVYSEELSRQQQDALTRLVAAHDVRPRRPRQAESIKAELQADPEKVYDVLAAMLVGKRIGGVDGTEDVPR